jgi:hypothetical protein
MAEAEARLEFVEEATLGIRRPAVGFANTKRHLVGVMAKAFVTQGRNRLAKVEALQ